MEGLVLSAVPSAPQSDFWSGRRVFVTGHSGFKGSWLTAWLTWMGALVHGYALRPDDEPNAFAALGMDGRLEHEIGDVRDEERLRRSLVAHSPEVVFHLAAQPLVRESYRDPVGTYSTNVMGTVNLLNAVRHAESVRAVVVVTSDKCYENREWVWGYREGDPLGGHDPYSSSKACAEIVTAAYTHSFFGQDETSGGRQVTVTSVRAGNVLGGGDWCQDRIVPDSIRAFVRRVPAVVRNPTATRPWQHVIDPLRGYLMLAERAYQHHPWVAGAWNFGPNDGEPIQVGSLVTQLANRWGEGAAWQHPDEQRDVHEAHSLRLYSTKARTELGWRPRLDLSDALDLTVSWYRTFYGSPGSTDLYDLTVRQIRSYGMEP